MTNGWKQWFALVALVLLIAGAAQAFQKISRAEEHSQYLKGLLSLSEEQTRQVYSALNEVSGKHRAGKGGKRSERMRLADEDKRIEALLTPDQLKKYSAYKKSRADRAMSRRQSNAGREQH